MQVFDADLDKVHEDNIRNDYGDDAEELQLGESLLVEQHYPIILMPHATLADCFTLIDGHRRNRAARRVGIKKLKAILVNKKLSPAEIRVIQLRIDLTRKGFTPYERSMAVIELRKANPGKTNKELAALIGMDESHFSKYGAAEKLSPEALEAYRRKLIDLTRMVEVAKEPPENQMDIIAKGASREDMRKERKRREGNGEPVVRASRIKCPLPSGAEVVVSGDQLTFDEMVEAMAEAAKLVKKAQDKGLTAATAMKMWRESAQAAG